MPTSLKSRGFELGGLRALGFAADGEDFVFPIHGPCGTVLALKRRRGSPNGPRYVYDTPGHGAPAWCSPGI